MRLFHVRKFLALMANIIALTMLAAMGSVVWLRGSPAGAQGRPVAADSIALTMRLDRYQYDLENNRTALITAWIPFKAYLVKDDQTALAGADVRLDIPKLGLTGPMTPAEPGVYSFTALEHIRITSPVPFLQTRDWRVENLQIKLDGKDETDRVTMQGNKSTAVNFHRKDLAQAGIGVFASPRTFALPTNSQITFRVVKPDGSPARNLTATVEFADHNYRQSFSTDGSGVATIDWTDDMQLTVSGGDLVTIDGPIFVEPPEDPDTLYWWEDPTERCEMDVRAEQQRLTARPGETARFGFEIRNKGNRPDDYHIEVDPVPEAQVEVEYRGDIFGLYPFFGQVVYVNVTPDRLPETKTATRKVNVTVSGSCQTAKIANDLKVLEFHEPVVDIYGGPALPGPEVCEGVRAAARHAGEDAITLIVRGSGPLPDSAKADIERLGGQVRQELGLINGLSVSIPAKKLANLEGLAWVSHVDENRTIHAMLDKSVPVLGAPDLWNLGYDGAGVTVAVVDTGVDYTHPALAGHVLLGPDFAYGDNDPMDDYGHGTHVAGIIASRDEQYRGVAPGATILAVKVLDEYGGGTLESVLAGVNWAAAHGAQVINLSLGGPGGYGDDPLAQAVDNAVKSGVVVVAAAGNSGPDIGTIGTPGDARLALTVGATNNTRDLMDWSSRGPTLDGRAKPDIVAPGLDITSTIPGGVLMMSGTSMATPQISGLAALLLQATHAEPLLIKEGLKQTATDLEYGPNSSGAGFPNPAAALNYIKNARLMVQQQAYPGDNVFYDFTLRNLGNVDDRFRMTQWFDDNGPRYRAQSTLPATAIRTFAADRLTSGGSVEARAQVTIPADWAGAEEAVYVFHLQATSMADRSATATDLATVRVLPTKRSIAEYAKRETADLAAGIRSTAMPSALRTDLAGRTNQLSAEEQRATAALAANSEATGNARLQSARTMAAELQSRIQTARDRGEIRAADAGQMLEQVRLIIAHLDSAEAKAMRKR